MIFFTRELFQGIQPDSGWERRAEREWYRRADVYAEYVKAIAPMLPTAVRRLGKASLHDAVVVAATLRAGELALTLDATSALSAFRGRQVNLIFRGVRGRPKVLGLVSQWWLYEELHLSAEARFSVHVLLDTDELVIAADELQIKLPAKKRRKKK